MSARNQFRLGRWLNRIPANDHNRQQAKPGNGVRSPAKEAQITALGSSWPFAEFLCKDTEVNVLLYQFLDSSHLLFRDFYRPFIGFWSQFEQNMSRMNRFLFKIEHLVLLIEGRDLRIRDLHAPSLFNELFEGFLLLDPFANTSL